MGQKNDKNSFALYGSAVLFNIFGRLTKATGNSRKDGDKCGKNAVIKTTKDEETDLSEPMYNHV